MEPIRLLAKLDPAAIAEASRRREIVIPLELGLSYVEQVWYHAQFRPDSRVSLEITARSIDQFRKYLDEHRPILNAVHSIWCADRQWMDELEALVVEQGIYPSDQCEESASTLAELEARRDDIRPTGEAADAAGGDADGGRDRGREDDAADPVDQRGTSADRGDG